jgi:small neutral amino acid transporter SnatA (MarC family)
MQNLIFTNDVEAAIERLTGMILILMSVDMVMSGISAFTKL